MAYNNYFPQGYYQPMMQYPNQVQSSPSMPPSAPSNAPAGGNNGITWVQGESAAKSFPVAAGQSVLLMDSESSVMYIKSTDQSGMPLPLRIFDYTERKAERAEAAGAANNGSVEYISREEFNEFKEDVKRSIKGIRRPSTREEAEE